MNDWKHGLDTQGGSTHLIHDVQRIHAYSVRAMLSWDVAWNGYWRVIVL